MERTAERTLMKSPPELWELADACELMERWCAALLGAAERVEVKVTGRESGQRLAWHARAPAWAAVEMTFAEKGFGTNVRINATSERGVRGDILDALLDELASPQRRPFARA